MKQTKCKSCRAVNIFEQLIEELLANK